MSPPQIQAGTPVLPQRAPQAHRQLEGIATLAPKAAAALIQSGLLHPCPSGQQDRLSTPASRGQILMEALSRADSSRVSAGLLASAARHHGLAQAVADALVQVGPRSCVPVERLSTCSQHMTCHCQRIQLDGGPVV